MFDVSQGIRRLEVIFEASSCCYTDGAEYSLSECSSEFSHEDALFSEIFIFHFLFLLLRKGQG